MTCPILRSITAAKAASKFLFRTRETAGERGGNLVHLSGYLFNFSSRGGKKGSGWKSAVVGTGRGSSAGVVN